MVEEIWLPQIDKVLCTGCNDCIVVCPTDALELVSGTAFTESVAVAVLTNPAACSYCAECETICPVEAIALPYQIVLESDL
ncbi:MAG: hypothetical protein DHS20C20_29590 [Ardenticatenaceae bacterium]|nr:MAG: hypothetical protein DHS20C20_29590 [Ardenticatenaceae bacterium]